MNHFHIGLRTVKTCLAVFICFLIDYLREAGVPFYAAIAAILCVQKDMDKSFKVAKNREIATVIGAFAGALFLLFNAPLLLIIHLLLSGSLFGILFANNAFLGFSYSGSTVSAMPGAFPDFIINARTPQYIHSLLVIIVIGLIYAIIYFLLTRGYFEFAAYDIVSSNRSKTIARKVIDAVGGIGNITTLNSTPHNLEIRIESLEDVSYEKLKQVGAWRVRETRDELVLEFGSSSTILRKNIQKIINESKRVYKEN